jgi:hypothetical protein
MRSTTIHQLFINYSPTIHKNVDLSRYVEAQLFINYSPTIHD